MNCKNCNSNLEDNSDYCNFCGAKVIRNRLTIKALFSHFSEEFLSYDNKFLKTFINLFSKPEDVIGCYISGTRKKYVNLITYFAIALTLSGFQIFIINKFFPELMNMDFLAQDGMQDFQKNNMAFVQEYQSIIYMLMVPVYALISKIVFFNFKEYNFTEHIVVNMYLAAHLSIISTVLIIISSFFGINFAIIGSIVIPLQIIFSAYCFKRLFNLSFLGIILRTLLFLLVSLVLYIITLIIVFGIIFLTQGPDVFKEIIEAQKTSSG